MTNPSETVTQWGYDPKYEGKPYVLWKAVRTFIDPWNPPEVRGTGILVDFCEYIEWIFQVNQAWTRWPQYIFNGQ